MDQSGRSALLPTTLPTLPQRMSAANPQVCCTTLAGADARETGGAQGLRQLIQTLPTKEDIQELMGDLLGPLREEVGEVRLKMEAIDHKLHNCEVSQDKADARIEDLEKKI